MGPTYDYNTIQAAIDAASSGDVINVATGTYTEQLHITTANITIQGSATSDVIVQSPDVLTDYYTTSADNYPIVFVDREVSKQFNVFGYPTFYLIDKKGIILYGMRGYAEEVI